MYRLPVYIGTGEPRLNEVHKSTNLIAIMGFRGRAKLSHGTKVTGQWRNEEEIELQQVISTGRKKK